MVRFLCGLSAFFIIFGGVFLVLAMLVDFSGRGDYQVVEKFLVAALTLFTIGISMLFCVGFGCLIRLLK